MRSLVSILLVAALVAPGRRARERGAADARRARERGHVSDLQDDARALELARRRSDPREIQRGIAAGTDEERDQGRTRGRVRRGVLAAPPREGFNLLAWVLPIAGAARGGCSRRRGGRWPLAGRQPSEPAADPAERARGRARPRPRAAPRRGARPLRRSRGWRRRSCPSSSPGCVSFVTPCVLPARTRLSLGRLRARARRASGRRVVPATPAVPRRLQLVFVALGAAAAAAAEGDRPQTGKQAAASSSWSSASPSWACCRSRCSSGWRRRSWSRERAGAARALLLGGAFARVRRSLRGAVPRREPRARGRRRRRSRRARSSSSCTRSGSRCPSWPSAWASRWVTRCVALAARPLPGPPGGRRRLPRLFGLLLFFGRDWWLNVQVNRPLEFFGRR